MDLYDPEDVPDFDGIPDVLLVVGTTLKVKKVEGMVKGLAETMHRLKSRVVYIGADKLQAKTWGDYIDIFLHVDVQEWAKRQLTAIMSESVRSLPGSLPGWDMMESVGGRIQRFCLRI